MQPAQMLQGRTRETKIARDAVGRWFNDGDRIDHPNVAHSFDGWIDRADDGRFCLHNDINWAYIQLEGPAYFVRDANLRDGTVQLVLSGDLSETLDPNSLHEDAEGALWCLVRDGRCPARFDNHALIKLEDAVGEDDRGTYVSLDENRFYPIKTSTPTELGVDKAKAMPMESR
ncbi:MAG: hypothetical protein R3A47_12515 [Polyangiales bacterium]